MQNVSPARPTSTLLVKSAVQAFAKENGASRARADFWEALDGFAKRASRHLFNEALSDKYARMTYAQKTEAAVSDTLADFREPTVVIAKSPMKATILKEMLRSANSSGRLPPNVLAGSEAALRRVLSSLILCSIEAAQSRRAPKSLVAADVERLSRDSRVVGAGFAQM